MAFKGFPAFVARAYKKWTILWCLFAATFVLAVDYFSGIAIRFPIVYVLPVGMAAWREHKLLAYLLALLLPFARVVFHYLWNETQLLSEVLLNASIAVLALLLYAYMLDRIAWQKRTLEKEVKVLEGILPVCASCKRIRTEEGEYQQIERYITERSEASFSHGICPDCAAKLYPDFYAETQQ